MSFHIIKSFFGFGGAEQGQSNSPAKHSSSSSANSPALPVDSRGKAHEKVVDRDEAVEVVDDVDRFDLRSSTSGLDLTEIYSRIFVAGLPYRAVTSVQSHRNNDEKLATHLLDRFGVGHFIVLNLAPFESTNYDVSKFANQVVLFPPELDGSDYIHTDGLPTVEQTFAICYCMKFFLDLDSENVVVLHDINGRTRTAFVIACFLAWNHSSEFDITRALSYFMTKRGVNRKTSVFMPSWMQSLKSFEAIVRQPGPVRPRKLQLAKITANFPGLTGISQKRPLVQVFQGQNLVFDSDNVAIADPEALETRSVFMYDEGALICKVERFVEGDVHIYIFIEMPNVLPKLSASAWDASDDMMIQRKLIVRYAFHTNCLPQDALITLISTKENTDLPDKEVPDDDLFHMGIILSDPTKSTQWANHPLEKSTSTTSVNPQLSEFVSKETGTLDWKFAELLNLQGHFANLAGVHYLLNTHTIWLEGFDVEQLKKSQNIQDTYLVAAALQLCNRNLDKASRLLGLDGMQVLHLYIKAWIERCLKAEPGTLDMAATPLPLPTRRRSTDMSLTDGQRSRRGSHVVAPQLAQLSAIMTTAVVQVLNRYDALKDAADPLKVHEAVAAYIDNLTSPTQTGLQLHLPVASTSVVSGRWLETAVIIDLAACNAVALDPSISDNTVDVPTMVELVMGTYAALAVPGAAVSASLGTAVDHAAANSAAIARIASHIKDSIARLKGMTTASEFNLGSPPTSMPLQGALDILSRSMHQGTPAAAGDGSTPSERTIVAHTVVPLKDVVAPVAAATIVEAGAVVQVGPVPVASTTANQASAQRTSKAYKELDAILAKADTEGLNEAQLKKLREVLEAEGLSTVAATLSPSTTENTAADIDPSLQKYMRMAALRVPIDAVLHKARQDGMSEEQCSRLRAKLTSSTGATQAAAGEGAGDTTDFSKYIKMQKLGVPLDAIMSRAKQDGFDQLEKLREQLTPPSSSSAATGDDAASVTTPSDASDVDVALQKYLKMAKLSIPAEAIIHKATQDGLPANLMDALKAKLMISPAASTSSTESSVDDASLEKYVKMSKMRIPAEAILHKAKQDSLDAKHMERLHQLLGVASPSGPETPTLHKFKRMLQQGVPKDTVLEKAAQEGLPAPLQAELRALIEAQEQEAAESSMTAEDERAKRIAELRAEQIAIKNASVLPLKDSPIYGQYFRMVKVGVPQTVVEHRVILAKLDPAVLRMDPDKPNEKAPVPLCEDPLYTTYFTMLRRGLPKEVVLHKMKMEKANDLALELDPDLPTPTGLSVTFEARSPKAAAKKTPKVQRKKLYWEALPADRLSSRRTIWSDVSAVLEGQDDLLNDEEFDQLFTQVVAASQSSQTASQGADAHKIVYLIEHKRGRNVAIGLKKLKLPYDVVRSCLTNLTTVYTPAGTRAAPSTTAVSTAAISTAAISTAEASETAPDVGDGVINMSLEQLIILEELLPTPDEINLVKSYKGDRSRLGEAEQFFLALCDVPKAKQRASALCFQLQFAGKAADLQSKVQCILAAVDQVKTSNRLKRMLEAILLLGNKLNASEGSASPASVTGFTLNSLLKLSQTKAFNNKVTLLHYLVSRISRVDPDTLLLSSDLDQCGPASRLAMEFLRADLTQLKQTFAVVERLVREQIRAEGGVVRARTGSLHEGSMDAAATADVSAAVGTAHQTIADFIAHTQTVIAGLEKMMNDTSKSFADLLEFFGEAPSMTVENFFGTIATFCRAVDVARADNEAEELKAIRDARRASMRFQTASPSAESSPRPEITDATALAEVSAPAKSSTSTNSTAVSVDTDSPKAMLAALLSKRLEKPS